MPRVKTGSTRHAGHKKIFSLAKGFRMSRHRLFKTANEAVVHAGQYAYIGRKEKKQQMRTLWIKRISAALAGLIEAPSYSKFVANMKTKNIKLDRKALSEMAIKLPNAFKDLVSFTSSK